MERCFACGKPLHGDGERVACIDDQEPMVGSDCFKKIRKSGAEGYQPKRGGPRLYTLEEKRGL
jgi:hypothetical protein